ncbi:MAG: C1 family peptidase [Prevotellaceae bacterium]|nr:C1 family peptidase [Candidatus Colivivens equi]
MRKFLFVSCGLALSVTMMAQGISSEMLNKMKVENKMTASDKAIYNAMAANNITVLAANQSNKIEQNTYFSNSVPSKGITDQKSSGRCWLFTGLNVLRSKVINQRHLEGLEFSQLYCFFYDQLEKSNLFLQAVIDTKDKPFDDKTVEWLFHNPLSDGGTYTGVADLVMKYGLVPAGVMPETFASNNTSNFVSFLKRKLREDGITLRESQGNLQVQKEKMLSEIYHMLTLGFGEPITEFTWAPKDKNGKYLSAPKKYTPKSFYDELIGDDLNENYVMLMNDPTRPYWKTYEIEYDRHLYDGHNWKYLNLPLQDIKAAAIESIKDSTMMYFSCDVSKELDKTRGLLDLKNFDYESIFGVKFGMDKRQRIITFDSGSSHAMTLMAVDIDAEGKPIKWKVENSWGASYGYSGHLIMTDEWFDEYMFRLVVNKKYLSDKARKASEQKPVMLPCYDPMFAMEE